MNWRPAVDIFLPIIILGKSDIGHYLANFFCFNKTKKKLNARRRYYRREKEEKKKQFSWVRLLFSRSGHSISKEELYGKWLSEHMADALVLNFFLFCVLHTPTVCNHRRKTKRKTAGTVSKSALCLFLLLLPQSLRLSDNCLIRLGTGRWTLSRPATHTHTDYYFVSMHRTLPRET